MAEEPAKESVTFSHLVLSLATSVQMGLGLVQNPATGKTDRDLPMASQTINLLELLQEKTKGNLSDEESKLMEELLFTLRMQFVEIEKQART